MRPGTIWRFADMRKKPQMIRAAAIMVTTELVIDRSTVPRPGMSTLRGTTTLTRNCSIGRMSGIGSFQSSSSSKGTAFSGPAFAIASLPMRDAERATA